MNRYKKMFYQNETKQFNKQDRKLSLLVLKLKLELYKYFDFKSSNILFGLPTYSFLHYIMCSFSSFNSDVRDVVFNKLLSKFDETALINEYMIILTDYLTENDLKNVDVIMQSFIKAGVIQDIKLDTEKNVFNLKTNDGKNVKFSNATDDKELLAKAANMCHAITNAFIKEYSNKTNELLYAVTVVENSFLGIKHYHSFVVNEKNIVIDFAQNILMPFDDYKKLLNPEIIMFVEGNQLLRNIKSLKEKDYDFRKDNKYSDLLKYSMHKHEKKKKKTKNI